MHSRRQRATTESRRLPSGFGWPNRDFAARAEALTPPSRPLRILRRPNCRLPVVPAILAMGWFAVAARSAQQAQTLEPAPGAWVGQFVVVGVDEAIPLKDGPDVRVEDADDPPRIWRVTRVEGPFAHLVATGEDPPATGWVLVRQVVLLGQAADHFTRLIEANPSAWAYSRRSFVRIAIQEPDAALADLDQALHLDPLMVDYWVRRAELRAARDDSPGAIADYTAAIRLQPENKALYSARALCFGLEQDYPAAIADYTEIIRLDPKYPPNYQRRGELWEESGAFDKAIADFT